MSERTKTGEAQRGTRPQNLGKEISMTNAERAVGSVTPRFVRAAPATLRTDDAKTPLSIELNEPALGEHATCAKYLACYLEGWAQANPVKILTATVRNYRFDDPVVGFFTRTSLPRYFALLQSRFASQAEGQPLDATFLLRGPMLSSSRHKELQFWRCAPRLGLSGVSRILVGDRGIIAETVAYDLNVACAVLRGTSS